MGRLLRYSAGIRWEGGSTRSNEALWLFELKLADDGILGKGFAHQLAESHAAAVADAGEVHRIVVAEEVALNVANGIQSGDNLIVLGHDLGLGVAVKSEGDSQQAADVLGGVERSGLNGCQELSRNGEVNIL